MVVPHTLDGSKEAVSLYCALDGLCASPRRTDGLGGARVGECGDDAVLCQLVKMFRDDSLDAIVELIAIFA